MQIFNEGDYLKAVEQKIASETISKVLYPSDAVAAGQELRLVQEYFLVACAIRDIIRRYEQRHATFDAFADEGRHSPQRHSSSAGGRRADAVPRRRAQPALGRRLARSPRRPSAIRTIRCCLRRLRSGRSPCSSMFCRDTCRSFTRSIVDFSNTSPQCGPDDRGCLRRMSIIEEGGAKQVRMAHLAIVGATRSTAFPLFTAELVQTTLAPDFYRAVAGALQQQDERRHTAPLVDASKSSSGEPDHQSHRRRLDHRPRQAPRAWSLGERRGVPRRVRSRSSAPTRQRLARVIAETTGVAVDPDSLFDVHVKRIHEYKRQLLNVMHIVHRVSAVDRGRRPADGPRTYIFAGKAAPGYWAAKQIIRTDLRASDRSSTTIPERAGISKSCSFPTIGFRWRNRSSPRRRQRADFNGGHGGVGDRQHEAGDERRADDRHARRSQHRDARRGGRGQHLHLRPDSRGGAKPGRRRSLSPARHLHAVPPYQADLRRVRFRFVVSG